MEPEVLLGRELVVEGLLLEDEADVAAHRLGPGGDVEAGDRGPPDGGPGEGAQHLDGGGLAGTVRAEEGEDLALAHREVDPVDRRQVTVALGEATNEDGSRRVGGPGRSGAAGCVPDRRLLGVRSVARCRALMSAGPHTTTIAPAAPRE